MITQRTLLAGLLLFALAARANADGCFFIRQEVGRSSALVASPKQEAILATDGSTVQVVLRTHFRAGPEELAWVVPVPARPTNIRRVDDSVFSKLDEITAPRFYREVPDNNPLHFHLGCGVSPGQQVSVAPVAVRVEETGSAGVFNYTVLSADDPAALAKWLNDNKYRVPDGAEPIFKHYVDQKWFWLAMKVRPDASKQPTLAPHPISYSYAGTGLVFPLVISRLSADRENEIVLYVVGFKRYRCSRWDNKGLDDMEDLREIRPVPEPAGKAETSQSGTNYEELVRQKTKEKDGHLFVTEFSQEWEIFGHTAGRGRLVDDALDGKLIDSLGDRQTVTRLRAYVLAESMNQDVVLSTNAGAGTVRNSVRVADASAAMAPPACLALSSAVLLLPCGLLAVPVRRRSGRVIRRAGMVLVCVLIFIL